MTLDELIEKITDIKKDLNEFEDFVFNFDDTIISDTICVDILAAKEEAYEKLVYIKDTLLGLEG